MSLVEPTLADPLRPEDAWKQAAERITPFSEYIGAKFQQGVLGTIPARVYEHLTAAEPRAAPEEEVTALAPDLPVPQSAPPTAEPVMPQEEWKGSTLYRPNLHWDPGMTRSRAEALAARSDRDQWLDSVIARSDAGFGGQVAGFVAEALPGLADPTNYVPVLGAADKAAAVARFGTILGSASFHAAEAAANSILFEPIRIATDLEGGRDVTLGTVAADIALNAVAGAMFGGVGGLLERRQQMRVAGARQRVEGLVRDLDATNVAADAMANEGGPEVDVGRVVGELPRAPAEGTRPIEGFADYVARREAEGTATTAAEMRLDYQTDMLRSERSAAGAPEFRAKVADDGTVEVKPTAGAGAPEKAAPVAAATSKSADISGMGKGIVSAMYDSMFDLYRRGEVNEAGRPSIYLQVAKAITDRSGRVLGRDEFEQLVKETNAARTGKTAAEQNAAARDIIDRWAGGAAKAPEVATAPSRTPLPTVATPEPPHPSVAEAAPRVGKATPELETFAKDAGLEGYSQPLPGYEPKPEAAAGEAPKPEPTPEEKAATAAAAPPEVQDIEAMKRGGSFTPEDDATLRQGEAEAQRAEGIAVGYETLVSCVLRFGGEAR